MKKKSITLEAETIKDIQQNIYSTPQSQKAFIDNDDNDSEKEELLVQEEIYKKQLRDIDHKIKAQTKMVVGTGFTFDIGEFFSFKRKTLQSRDGNWLNDYVGGHFSWLLLLYSVINAAIIPAWIMNIRANKILRISWRFLMQTLMIVPFVLYESRSQDANIQAKYKLSHIFNPNHLKKAYLSGFAQSCWFLIVLTSFQWTYISHAIFLGSLSNFFLSIGRTFNRVNHSFQPGGQVLVITGVLLIINDSITINPANATDQQTNVINPLYLKRQWYQRALADLAAFGAAFVMSRFSQYTADLRTYYPPYLSMLLVNISLSITLAFGGYYINGCTFDFQSKFGILSVFTQEHFASFLYMSIILCMGLFLSFTLISKLFPDPIIPALTMTLQPAFATFFLQIGGVQMMPGPYSFFGYILIIPGLFLILVGQCLFQKEKNNVLNEQDKKRLEIMEELKKFQDKKKLFNQRCTNSNRSKSLYQSGGLVDNATEMQNMDVRFSAKLNEGKSDTGIYVNQVGNICNDNITKGLIQENDRMQHNKKEGRSSN